MISELQAKFAKKQQPTPEIDPPLLTQPVPHPQPQPQPLAQPPPQAKPHPQAQPHPQQPPKTTAPLAPFASPNYRNEIMKLNQAFLLESQEPPQNIVIINPNAPKPPPIEEYQKKYRSDLKPVNKQELLKSSYRQSFVPVYVPKNPIASLYEIAEHDDKSYKRVRQLPNGGQGKLYLAEFIEDNNIYVIKTIDFTKISEAERQLALKEPKFMQQFDHPNIIKLREAYLKRKDQNLYLRLVMEYADGGDLLDRIICAKDDGHHYFSEQSVTIWFKQICSALLQLHQKGITHRDLKPSNFFLSRANQIKLGDFGIACNQNENQGEAFSSGTIQYLAPEVVSGKPFTLAADVWALGIILYQMCSLELPFNGSTPEEIKQRILEGTYKPIPEVFSEQLRGLISKLLKPNPNERPAVGEILANLTPQVQTQRQFDEKRYQLCMGRLKNALLCHAETLQFMQIVQLAALGQKLKQMHAEYIINKNDLQLEKLEAAIVLLELFD